MQKLGWLIPIMGVLGIAVRGHAFAQSGEPGSQNAAMRDYTFITFDAPGAGRGIFPQAINANGTVTGNYTDANNVGGDGFVRLRDCDSEDRDWSCIGTVKTFDVPGVGTGGGVFPNAINDKGTITGYYKDSNNVIHGFVRTRDCDASERDSVCGGMITTFDAPGAGMSASQGTFALAINGEGAITGYYLDANNLNHGFVRTRDCEPEDHAAYCDVTIKTFEVPNAGTGAGLGTLSTAINAKGTITGYYIDANVIVHGFVRLRDGTFISFDAPGAGASFKGTFPSAINAKGEITGVSTDMNFSSHGFLRRPDGVLLAFNVPGAPDRTYVSGINAEGAIAGDYLDSNNRFHAYVRARNGTITTFEVPAAGEANFYDTFATGINRAGTVTGSFSDANHEVYGFLAIPNREHSGR